MWEDVGGLDLLRMEFERYIVRRIKYPEEYEVYYVRHSFFFFLHLNLTYRILISSSKKRFFF